MKNWKTSVLGRSLAVLARAVLRKFHPTVIAVTGSVGKTSATNAIATVLSARFSVWKNAKNFNNEIGVPLAILGIPKTPASVWQWCHVYLRGISMLVFPFRGYPALLVLELGVDHPGDMAYLLTLVAPKVGVLTAVSAAHTEFLGTIDDVFREKALLVERLPQDGLALLNTDDERCMSLRSRLSASVRSFGFNDRADVQGRMEEVDVAAPALRSTLTYQGTVVPIAIQGVLGEHQVYGLLAAAAVGLSFGMNLVEIARALERYQPLPGRMRVLPGIKHTLLIDDTYNAQPQATHAALDAVSPWIGKQRVFVCLGDMAELGQYADAAHEEVGKHVARLNPTLLVTAGALGKSIARAAQTAGFPEDRCASFDTAAEAGKFLQERLAPGDVVLVKGAQMMRMEKVVKELMAEPERAGELLVRQDGAWLHS